MPATTRETARKRSHTSRRCRQRGAEYILFPETAFWWLEFYEELRGQLEHPRAGRAGANTDSALIYGLETSEAPGSPTSRATGLALATEHTRRPRCVIFALEPNQ